MTFFRNALSRLLAFKIRVVLISAIVVILANAGCTYSRRHPEPNTHQLLATSHFAKYGTNKIHYLVAGRGPKTIVFVHGWSCNAEFWRNQIPSFADKARLIIIDLPGHGQSDKPHTRYTTDFFAGAVLAAMRDARVSRAVLVGHSMGTGVICRIYSRAPEKVSALVDVDGFLQRHRRSPDDAEQFIAPYRAANYRDKMAQFVRAMFPNPGTTALQEWTLAQMLQTPQHVIVSAMEEPLVAADQPDWDLKSVDVPLLVINNPFWNKDYENYARSLSHQTDYRVIEGVGHFLMLEKPDEFNTTLADMLQKFALLGN